MFMYNDKLANIGGMETLDRYTSNDVPKEEDAYMFPRTDKIQ